MVREKLFASLILLMILVLVLCMACIRECILSCGIRESLDNGWEITRTNTKILSNSTCPGGDRASDVVRPRSVC